MIFFIKFLSTIMNRHFNVDTEIVSPWVQRGQEFIWNENNPNHDMTLTYKYSESGIHGQPVLDFPVSVWNHPRIDWFWSVDLCPV